jgi:hypothetical protein
VDGLHRRLTHRHQPCRRADAPNSSSKTKGKGTYEVTNKVAELIRAGQVQTGLVNVFLRYTSARLIVFENADCPRVMTSRNFSNN